MNQLAHPTEMMFPQRRSNHSGTWVPLYLEPMPGSGERICIGVAAADSLSSVVVPVERLDRFSCVYGQAASSLAWAAELAITEVQQLLNQGGLKMLDELQQRIDGFIVGAQRRGAGTGLVDLARLALEQVSALYGTAMPQMVAETHDTEAQQPIPRLESYIRRLVVGQRPLLERSFGRTFRRSQTARPLRYGFVGRLIAANFASLSAPGQISTQVDRAKARLWDLHQFNDGVLADSLPLQAASISYELLVHRSAPRLAAEHSKAMIRAAEEELEAESDKFDIRFRLMQSPEQIANYLIQREAA